MHAFDPEGLIFIVLTFDVIIVHTSVILLLVMIKFPDLRVESFALVNNCIRWYSDETISSSVRLHNLQETSLSPVESFSEFCMGIAQPLFGLPTLQIFIKPSS